MTHSVATFKKRKKELSTHSRNFKDPKTLKFLICFLSLVCVYWMIEKELEEEKKEITFKRINFLQTKICLTTLYYLVSQIIVSNLVIID